MLQLDWLERVPQRQVATVATAKRHFDPGDNDDWYTPAEYISAARAVMGGIDLDPASCEVANVTVQAAHYFDVATNGLQQRWHGRVWLNPPYSRKAGRASSWAAKLLAEYSAGRVQQACMLVNVATAYQKPMQQLAELGCVCLVDRRIAFIEGATGEPARSPVQPNVIYYLGEHREAFSEYFRRFGAVLSAFK